MAAAAAAGACERPSCCCLILVALTPGAAVEGRVRAANEQDITAVCAPGLRLPSQPAAATASTIAELPVRRYDEKMLQLHRDNVQVRRHVRPGARRYCDASSHQTREIKVSLEEDEMARKTKVSRFSVDALDVESSVLLRFLPNHVLSPPSLGLRRRGARARI